LRERAKLSKSHIDALREAGALSGLRESMHMELFS
jgi:DNA polymerase III alpha subunit (gram-positive type)